jgi:hypothetical protein
MSTGLHLHRWAPAIELLRKLRVAVPLVGEPPRRSTAPGRFTDRQLSSRPSRPAPVRTGLPWPPAPSPHARRTASQHAPNRVCVECNVPLVCISIACGGFGRVRAEPIKWLAKSERTSNGGSVRRSSPYRPPRFARLSCHQGDIGCAGVAKTATAPQSTCARKFHGWVGVD